ncbi:MAG: GIN domain-containing protein, partial [Ferruginibacter sp.]
MKHILIAFLLIAGFSATAQQDALEASNVEKRTISASFSKISVMDGIDLYLSQSKDQAVAVSASEEKYLKRIITEVENGTLKIYYDTKGPTLNGKKHLKAYVSFDQIDHLTATSGASVVLKEKITLNQLKVKLTSG